GLYPIGRLLYFSPYRKVAIDRISVSIEQQDESRLYVYVDVYWVRVSYEYMVDDSRYSSGQVGFSDGLKFQSKERAEKFADSVRAIGNCYYSLKSPIHSHLVRSISVGDGDNTYSLIAGGASFNCDMFVLRAISLEPTKPSSLRCSSHRVKTAR